MSTSNSFADDGEVLDSMITRSRGEIKRVCSPRIRSTSATPTREIKGIQSPSMSISDKLYSPRVSELRENQRPRLGGLSPKSSETRPSNLGKNG